MILASLALLLFQVAAQNTGAVTGVVRSAGGAPAAGVRVYAMSVRDVVESGTTPAALESQAETDASGRYRLEVPAGRYHIASGSVVAPTYYPGTTDAAAARIVAVAVNALVDNVDFGSYVPASRSPLSGLLVLGPPTGSTGVLSGVIRYPDGAPAARITVVAVPVATVTPTGSVALPTPASAALLAGVVRNYRLLPVATDANGRYRIENVPPETYYIAAGFAEAPVFYPGTPLPAARSVTTTPATVLDNLDFTVGREVAGAVVSGRVTGAGGVPAVGAYVRIRNRASTNSPLQMSLGLPSRTFARELTVGSDGTFEFRDIAPGEYILQASIPGVQGQSKDIVAAGRPVSGLDFVVSASILSGRISFEDGSPLPDASVFKEAIVTTVRNPNLRLSTVFTISSGGTFSRVLESEEVRFYLRFLPNGYVIRSIMAAEADLLKETLKIDGSRPVNVDVRVARREAANDLSETGHVKVSGTVVDVASGNPPSVEGLTLCCLDAGPVQGFSTPLRPDGSFEFSAVPPGRYTVGLQVRPNQPSLFVVNSTIEVGNQGLSFVALSTASSLMPFVASVMLENGGALPAGSSVRVAFRGMTRSALVIDGVPASDGKTFTASLPVGVRYEIMVTPPAGYVVKSISTAVDPFNANPSAKIITAVPATAPASPTVIILAPGGLPPPAQQ